MASSKGPESSTKVLARKSAEFGGGLLPVVAAAGLIMVMTQGTIFYKAKTSNKFLADERNRIMALQAAEAGVESAISDIGSRRLVVNNSMHNYVSAQNVEIGAGKYTTTLTTLGMGPGGDTVNLLSRGTVSQKDKKIEAKLRLHNFLDSVLSVSAVLDTDTVVTVTPTTVVKMDTTIQDPTTMPALNTTAAYTACMSSSAKKCDVCHLPGGDYTKANVINIAKSAISTHISHHGDYVTTDGTCDIYQPKVTSTNITVLNTVVTYPVTIVYDTAMTVDTLVKVQILSWR